MRHSLCLETNKKGCKIHESSKVKLKIVGHKFKTCITFIVVLKKIKTQEKEWENKSLKTKKQIQIQTINKHCLKTGNTKQRTHPGKHHNEFPKLVKIFPILGIKTCKQQLRKLLQMKKPITHKQLFFIS